MSRIKIIDGFYILGYSAADAQSTEALNKILDRTWKALKELQRKRRFNCGMPTPGREHE
jgi:hypothetical protein